jgi:hypothetical protein
MLSASDSRPHPGGPNAVPYQVQFRRRFDVAESIYKFFMAKMLEPWYQLSKEEQNSLVAKLDAALENVGAKRPILCNSSWSSDQWSFAGMEEFPNIE